MYTIRQYGVIIGFSIKPNFPEIQSLTQSKPIYSYYNIIHKNIILWYLDTIILRVLAFVKNSMQRLLLSVGTSSTFALVIQGDFHSPWKRVVSSTRDTIPNAILNQPTQRNWSTDENWATSALTPARKKDYMTQYMYATGHALWINPLILQVHMHTWEY